MNFTNTNNALWLLTRLFPADLSHDLGFSLLLWLKFPLLWSKETAQSSDVTVALTEGRFKLLHCVGIDGYGCAPSKNCNYWKVQHTSQNSPVVLSLSLSFYCFYYLLVLLFSSLSYPVVLTNISQWVISLGALCDAREDKSTHKLQ